MVGHVEFSPHWKASFVVAAMVNTNMMHVDVKPSVKNTALAFLLGPVLFVAH